MTRRPKPWILIPLLILLASTMLHAQTRSDPLDSGWRNPPRESRLLAYWWWLNGDVTRASITRDLEQMKAKGFGGAVLIDAGGADQAGNAQVPHGPTFFTPAWRALYQHALREARRLGLDISLNIQSGWNLGGPVVTPDDAAKKYVWSEVRVRGGSNLDLDLTQPRARDGFYRDFAVVAFGITNSTPHPPLKNWRQKALQESLQPFSAPDSSPLFAENPAMSDDADAKADGVVDLSSGLEPGGRLHWAAPPGEWLVLRFGYTIGDHAYVSTASEGWSGSALDVYSAAAFQHYWDKIVEPLIADAGSLAGKTLKYLHTDSWEIELANWTPQLRGEFLQRRGYDLLPWLPVLAGRIVNSRDQSDRFLFDYRKTLGDLTIDGHYRPFRDNAHRHGLGIHPESGGPHAVPIDAQRDLGWDDVPMSEFWAWSWEHRIGDSNRFFVKQPASAAHTYGRRISQDEGFTTIGPNWQEHLWDNLKPAFDQALCEGMNRLVWHAFVCSPDETGIPGQQYFAGTHLNPKVTWWDKSAPFFDYINRCQFMLEQGLFVADVLYYYGDHVPNFTQLKHSDPAHILPGYDYDVISEEALLERTAVRDGKIVLPDGMSYRILVLPDRDSISIPVLKKIAQLVAAGATVIGPKPTHAETLENYPACDAEITALANELWDGNVAPGRVITGKTAREVLLADGIPPDCSFALQADPASPNPSETNFDYIHRRTGDADIYFVANRSTNFLSGRIVCRVINRVPELWNAVTGERRRVGSYFANVGDSSLRVDLDPCGSCFLIFRNPKPGYALAENPLPIKLSRVLEIFAPWTVHFDPKWGGPASAQFDSLASWTTREEPGIKFYSGTAAYEKTFTLGKPDKNIRVLLDLGSIRELAEVKVNGRSCGILWCPPFRADITAAIKSGENKLRIEVVNFWPNRIIGDASLPPAQRFTRTNIRALTAATPLEPSGLFGPVHLLESKN